ncbi:MAG: SOS response-associated peptidase family protein [Verrucomicrobiae bacterium]|nr:SOS response-associated peptidase family protein [Verrucomicrobiae bacterium]
MVWKLGGEQRGAAAGFRGLNGLSFGTAMCNLYDIGPASVRQARGGQRQVIEALESVPKRFGIRRTDPALVVRRDAESGELVPEVMRWGFQREFSSSINNSRTDKLGSPMWAESWRERRCLIPVATFYEWSGGEKGAKQTYALRHSSGDWMWMAGLWEPGGDSMPRFSMITTEASGVIASIHDRMPAILPDSRLEAYLEAPMDDPSVLFRGLRDDLEMFPCLNPLKQVESGPPMEERFLF